MCDCLGRDYCPHCDSPRKAAGGEINYLRARIAELEEALEMIVANAQDTTWYEVGVARKALKKEG